MNGCFTDQKPFVAFAADVQAFNKHGRTWQCSLCGHVFVAGDVARWIYANGTKGLTCGNFFVCARCDGPDSEVLERAGANFDAALSGAKRWRLVASVPPGWND